MKGLFRKISIILIACLCICSLSSCEGGIKGDEAKATINDFFEAIVAEDYDGAEALIHPDRSIDLEAFFLQVEQNQGVDFQAGIEIEKYTGFSSTVYSSNTGGSSYELSMNTRVGDKTVYFTVEVVKNDNGYGIYNCEINT